MKKEITIKHKKGYFNGDTSWWTKEDWDKEEQDVAEMKRTGEFGKEVEFTISYDTGHFSESEVFNKPTLRYFGLLIPTGKDGNNVPFIEYIKK